MSATTAPLRILRVTQGSNPMVLVRDARGDTVGMYRRRDGAWQYRRGWDGRWEDCAAPTLPQEILDELLAACRGT